MTHTFHVLYWVFLTTLTELLCFDSFMCSLLICHACYVGVNKSFSSFALTYHGTIILLHEIHHLQSAACFFFLKRYAVP